MNDRDSVQKADQGIYADRERKLRDFVSELIKEYEDKLKSVTKRREESANRLKILEEKQKQIIHIKEDSTSLFSPNVRLDDMDEIAGQIKEEKDEADRLLSEYEEAQNRIKKLRAISDIIGNGMLKKKESGLDMLKFQEQDRQRIARDLHDSTVQSMTGIIHKLELCQRMIDIDPVRAKLELAAISKTVRSVISETREIIYNLKPMTLDDLGLHITIERYAKQLMANHGIKVNVRYNNFRPDIEQIVKISLFQVVKEACNNIIKHAEASEIEIYISYEEDCVTISIKDNGIGFDMDRQKASIADDRSGYGLSIMRERIHMHKGTLKIHPNNPTGTVVIVSVPLSKYGEDKNEQTD